MTAPKLHIADNLSLPIEAVKAAESRLFSGIEKLGPDDCWLWKRSTDTCGYGHLRVCGQLHRAYSDHVCRFNGWFPPVVMHKCDIASLL